MALRQFDFVVAEFRLVQQLHHQLENVVEVFLKAGPADRGGVAAGCGFDFSGAGFEEVIHLIAGMRPGSSGSPHLSVNLDQPRFLRGFVARPRADADGAVDQGKLVIFLQENHHTVGEFDAPGFGGMKRG